MRRGEGARLAASFPHQLTFTLSTSFLQKFNPLSWPDEAVGFNQMLRRQRPKRPEQRLAFVSGGGNESVGTAHRQTEGWREGPVTSDQGPARIRSL